MSQSQAGVSSQVMVLKIIGDDVILDVDGAKADEVRSAVEDAWSWCTERRRSGIGLDPQAPHIKVVLDEDPDVVADATQRGAIAATELPALMHLLTQAITVAGIDRQAGRFLMLHAAAVADPQSGRAVAVVAPAGVGKTTFARSMGRGRVYLSDETVALREDHTIVPYPKPLSLHTTGINHKEQVGPQHAELVQPTGSCALAALWALERRDEPTPARLEPLTTLEAITTIAPQLSYLSSLPRPLHRLASAIEAANGMSRVVYHEADDLQDLVDDALGATR
jgi:hypothetical protein